ncbi:MAG: PfkB family carbohydrate kinase [Acidobacteriota bacterium]
MTTAAVLRRFPQLSALVVGDICLDRWCTYDPALAEASRETGIPRIAVTNVETTPGAGGTIANNLAALGAGRIAVLGAIGEDGFGWELQRALRARGISPDLLVSSPALQTFTYTKYWNSATGEEDLARTDFINAQPLAADVERRIVATLGAHAASFDVILVSDQSETDAGGVVTAAVREAVCKLSNRVIWVDSRLRAELFHNVIVKPNQREAEEACQRLFGRVDYLALRRHVGPHPLVVTQGGEGVVIVDGTGEHRVTTVPVAQPVDICGAGDSFSAGAALSMAACNDIHEAARIGNLVASITIMKKGTGTATPAEVLAASERVSSPAS